MANVKNGALREKIIDQCLQSRRGYSTAEIMDRCNDALSLRGYPLVSSLNTIRNDMLSIENRWHVVIEEIRSGRTVRYRYENPEFSIFNTSLTDAETLQLSQSVSLLQRFEGMPGFDWVDEFTAHVQMTINSHVQPIVGFDTNKDLKGMNFFTPLYNNIDKKRVIIIVYCPYSGDEIEAEVHPYFLKEYNQRWFLIGLNAKLRYLSVFALDRIVGVYQSKSTYIESDIDFTSYFDDIIGVSHPKDGKIEEIQIWVDSKQLPYTLSKPLHKSQKVLKHTEDGSALISIKVIPNYELTQLLLSFGDHMLVISPAYLRNEIMERIKKNYKTYQLVQLD